MLANKAFCFVLKLNYLLRSLGSRSVCGFPVIARRQESGNECHVALLWLQSNTAIHPPGDTERQYLDTSYNGPVISWPYILQKWSEAHRTTRLRDHRLARIVQSWSILHPECILHILHVVFPIIISKVIVILSVVVTFRLTHFISVPILIGHDNTLRSRQRCRHFANDIFKCIF